MRQPQICGNGGFCFVGKEPSFQLGTWRSLPCPHFDCDADRGDPGLIAASLRENLACLSDRVIIDPTIQATASVVEILGMNPSIIEKMLVTSVVISYMDYQLAALSASQATDQSPIRLAREKILSFAQKRYHDAITTWERHVEKKNRGFTPKSKLKLFDPIVGGSA